MDAQPSNWSSQEPDRPRNCFRLPDVRRRFAQAGANPSAPQPGSTGIGVNPSGTTTTSTAVDRPDSMAKGSTSGMASGNMKKDKKHN
ncbi:hypothetical protein [Tardiphaga sp.]|uniref:hypothetical protein n=1 Tax=Tardiphaga sp. TaxID=1926292 RepID=UPI0025E99662|nr:hypothetical protein [Tardiphaga sp.]